MKENIKYTVEFFSYWHCGSGLAAGADVDALVIKDEKGLPFIPGRTMKGLIREAMETIAEIKGESIPPTLFGSESSLKAETFFSDATLLDKEHIIREGLAPFLFRTLSSTRIDDDGIAANGSLRKIEVVVPCVLQGEILYLDSSIKDSLSKSLSYIKSIGLNRKRGLGRCAITIIE